MPTPGPASTDGGTTHLRDEATLNSDDGASALDGLRVLDLTRVLAGPLCTMILGDLGADVLKVECPSGDETRHWGPPWVGTADERESSYFLSINRNKRSLAADLSDERDRSIVQRLAAGADVVVENFLGNSTAAWELDYDSVARVNPRVVYCSISGYGSRGPDSKRSGYDFAVQAETGWMAITGDPEGEPMKVGVAVVDVLTGQNAAIAILAALRERDRSGKGQRVEVSLYDSALAGLVNVAQSALVGAPASRYGNAHPSIVPYQTFRAADRPVAVAVGNDAQWVRLCEALEMPELGRDSRYASNPDRVERRGELAAIIEARIGERSAGEWMTRLTAAAVPCSLVRTVAEAAADAAFRNRGGIWKVEGNYGRVETIRSPIRLSRTDPRARRAPPRLGEHTDEIARKGWDADDRSDEPDSQPG